MRINNINYLQNFGLTKTENCLKVEKTLINDAQLLYNQGNLAKKIAANIEELLPNDTLDFNRNIEKFILTTHKNKEQYDVGGIIKKKPLKTLLSLYQVLKKFEGGGSDGSDAKPLKTNRIII